MEALHGSMKLYVVSSGPKSLSLCSAFHRTLIQGSAEHTYEHTLPLCGSDMDECVVNISRIDKRVGGDRGDVWLRFSPPFTL